jgi:hypothetical protein
MLTDANFLFISIYYTLKSSTTSLKLKTLWFSFFQPQNTYLIQKSMKSSTLDSNSSLTNSNDDSSTTTTTTASMPRDGDYRRRREKNNESVRKSRAKNRQILQECASHVQELRKENVQLNSQLSTLQDELLTLKSLFQHCFSFNLNNLSIKPSDIPTSTLYKIIMKKEMNNANGGATSSGAAAAITNK